MFGFLFSFILVILTTFYVVSMLKPKNNLLAFVYLILIIFAQIILISQILSVFYLLKPISFIIIQILFLIMAIVCWLKKGKPVYCFNPMITFKRIKDSILKDKLLLLMGCGFVFFLGVSCFLATVMGITSADGQIYHVARSLHWVNNASINHFETSQVRMLAFPINSEILYSWVILFTKSTTGLALFSFLGFILTVTTLFGLMNKYSINRRLWVIFLVSSFSSVLVQASGTETDIIIAGLVLSSMYLFKEGLKQCDNKNFYFSSLAYAIALGTKTTAFFLIPAVAMFFAYHSYLKLKHEFYKPILRFISFALLNFVIFSSYNYVQNFISFGNPLGAVNTIDIHKNHYGIYGAFANFIKNFTLFFDFTGFTWDAKFAEIILPIRDNLLKVLGLSQIPTGINSTGDNVLNNSLVEPLMGWGVVGFLTFVPASIISLIRICFTKSKIAVENVLFTGMFFVTLFVMSYAIVFMTFNNRFIATFVLICAPILGVFYTKKYFQALKLILVLFCWFYLTLISTHLWARPAVKIADALFVRHESLLQVQKRVDWQRYGSRKMDVVTIESSLIEKIKQYPKSKKIALFNSFNLPTAPIFELIFDGYKIDFKLWETVNIEDLETYDIIIDTIGGQNSNVAYREGKSISKDVSCVYVDLLQVSGFKREQNRASRVVCEPSLNYLQENFSIIDTLELGEKIYFVFLENKVEK